MTKKNKNPFNNIYAEIDKAQILKNQDQQAKDEKNLKHYSRIMQGSQSKPIGEEDEGLAKILRGSRSAPKYNPLGNMTNDEVVELLYQLYKFFDGGFETTESISAQTGMPHEEAEIVLASINKLKGIEFKRS